MAGTPAELRVAAEQEIQVRTSSVRDGMHGVVFNRGAIASQAYAQRFGNKQPDDVPNNAAYAWLSGGLAEALTAFIGQATGADWTVRAAVYEFSWPPMLQAFAVAAASGADVRIVADWTGSGPRATTEPALAAAGITDLVTHRTHIAIAHNKFVVLSFRGEPVAVWTGSTNLTEGGLYGQANVGHIVRDAAVAQRFVDYWDRLEQDPFQKDFKPTNDVVPAMPIRRLRRGTTVTFSPRPTLAALDWYGELADRAEHGVFLTAAFGVSDQLMAALTKDRDHLKYVLLDTDKGGAQLTIRDADPDNRVTVGAVVGRGGWGQWIREVTLGANKHVPVRAHEVPTHRPVVRRPDRGDRLGQLLQGFDRVERREHADHPGRHRRRRHLSHRVHAPVHALRVPGQGGERAGQRGNSGGDGHPRPAVSGLDVDLGAALVRARLGQGQGAADVRRLPRHRLTPCPPGPAPLMLILVRGTHVHGVSRRPTR